MFDVLLANALQTTVLLLLAWAVLRLAPAFPPSAKVWVWRLAFLKPVVGLLPFAALSLHVLPASVAATTVAQGTIGLATPSAPIGILSRSGGASVEVDPLLAMWLLGALGVAAFGLLGSARTVRLARRSHPPTSPDLDASLTELVRRAGLRRPIRLLVSSEVDGPMLLGGWRPSIVLPESSNDPARLDDARMMLAHEVAHVARHDLAWLGLIWVARSLFFFDPIVWLAARSARLDHESATDRLACQLTGEPTHVYADMLLRASVAARRPSLGALSMGEPYRSVHRRLEAMRHFEAKPSRRRASALVALVLTIVAAMPLYRLAEASPLGPPQGSGKLLYTVSKGPRNPFRYSVYQDGDRLWIQIEKDGKVRRFLWDDDKSGPGTEPKEGSIRGDAKGLSFRFVDHEVRDAVRRLCHQGGVSFVIDPRVQGDVTVSCQNIALGTALSNVLRQVGATYRFENGAYNVVPLAADKP